MATAELVEQMRGVRYLNESYPYNSSDEMAAWLETWDAPPKIETSVLYCAHCAPVLAHCLNIIAHSGGQDAMLAERIIRTLNEAAPWLSHEAPF